MNQIIVQFNLLNFFSSTALYWIVHILFTLYVIFNGRKNPRSNLIWIMIVNTIPFLGFILFLMLGKDTRKKKMFSLKQENDDMIEDIARYQFEQLATGKFDTNVEDLEKYSQLIKMNLISDNAFYSEDNEVDFYYWGKDKFLALLTDIENATKSIDIQYYIFKNDSLGREVIGALMNKAKEGVRVRLLIDDFGSRKLQKKYRDQLKQAGVEFQSFFSSFLGIINLRLNYRNHRKLVIIDDEIGYLGGFNVGDEYIGLYKKFGPWRDTHIRIKGTAVVAFKLRFLKDWYYTAGQEPALERDFDPVTENNGNMAAQVISSGPDTQYQNIKNAMVHMINVAKEAIYIQSPYFIPDQSMLDAMKMALLRGVELNIMIPAKADHPPVHWCSMSFVRELAYKGANIYAYKNGFMHAKVIFVDDMVSTIGTTNLDERSFSLNFETNIVMYDKQVNRELKKQYDIDISHSQLFRLEDFENRPWYVKVREPIARIFAPLM